MWGLKDTPKPSKLKKEEEPMPQLTLEDLPPADVQIMEEFAQMEAEIKDITQPKKRKAKPKAAPATEPITEPTPKPKRKGRGEK